MYFGLSEEQQFFQESINKFLEDNVTVDALKAYRTGENKVLTKTVYNGLNELGLSSLTYQRHSVVLGSIHCLQSVFQNRLEKASHRTHSLDHF